MRSLAWWVFKILSVSLKVESLFVMSSTQIQTFQMGWGNIPEQISTFGLQCFMILTYELSELKFC